MFANIAMFATSPRAGNLAMLVAPALSHPSTHKHGEYGEHGDVADFPGVLVAIFPGDVGQHAALEEIAGERAGSTAAG